MMRTFFENMFFLTKKNTGFIAVVLFLFGNSFDGFGGQSLANGNEKKLSAKQYLEKVKANYNGLESLEIEMNYQLYKGFESTVIEQAYNSIFFRSGENSYRKIDQIEFISNSELSLQINHGEKVIMISNPSNISAFVTDLESSLKLCRDVQVRKKEQTTLITMIIREKTDLPYSRLDLLIDANFWIQEITLFYSSEINFSESYFQQDMAYPKLVVSYQMFKDKWKDKEGLLITENYVTANENSYTASKRFADYKILDYRISH